jgi:hypothetical protein
VAGKVAVSPAPPKRQRGSEKRGAGGLTTLLTRSFSAESGAIVAGSTQHTFRVNHSVTMRLFLFGFIAQMRGLWRRTTMFVEYDSFHAVVLLIGIAIYLGGTLALAAHLGRV